MEGPSAMLAPLKNLDEETHAADGFEHCLVMFVKVSSIIRSNQIRLLGGLEKNKLSTPLIWGKSIISFGGQGS